MAELSFKLASAQQKVNKFFQKYKLSIDECQIKVDPEIGEGTLATWQRPCMVVVKKPDVPESVIAHELVHILQQTLEVFAGYRWLYTLLSEGLAEFIAQKLYPEHEIKHKLGYDLVCILCSLDEDIVKEIIQLDSLKLTPQDIDLLLASPNVHPYWKEIIKNQAEHLKRNIQRALEGRIDDPTFISFGEDLRSWKFLLAPKFDSRQSEIQEILAEFFD